MVVEERVQAIAGQFFRLLLYAYPASFRREFGLEMVQVFHDDMRATLQEDGLAGMAILWFITTLDLIKTALVERIWEIFHMPQESFTRLLTGIAAAIGAPLLYMTFGSQLFWETYGAIGLPAGDFVHPILAGTGFLLMGLGFYGFYRRLPTTMLSKIGLATAEVGVVLGLAGMVTWGQAISEPLVTAAFIPHPLALALMGVVALTTRSLGRFGFVPLAIVASFIGMALTATPGVEGMGLPIFLWLSTAGWALLGLAIALHQSREPAEPGLAA
ncbi:MAG: hypothetical protein PVG33_13655 [Chloroflexota bacterium]